MPDFRGERTPQPPAPPSEPRRFRWERLRVGSRRLFPFILTGLTAFLAFVAFYFIAIRPTELTGGYVSQAVAQALASATPPPAFSAQVYQVIQPSLVLIQTEDHPLGSQASFGLGSGVVIDQQGSVLTSLHVVAGAQKITVTFADGTKSDAQVIDKQPENDIAVLRTSKLPGVVVPAVLASPANMHVGDEAYVVGNPFGLYSSMSAGVISGFDRSFRPAESDVRLEGLIQVDAAVNPGNSGGPLLNRNGYVIGIVTGIVNPTQENFFVGIGFAVPINVAVGGMGSPPY
ncbi:MAG: S1C family serine protease [Bacteroidota bacterium]